MRIAVFHYHFLPGGVTQVVKASAAAAVKYVSGIDEITLVSGNKMNLPELTSEIREELSRSGKSGPGINSTFIPETGYISEMDKYPDPEDIASLLSDNFAGDLWWVHNYHIGKNPFFTEALLRTAAENPEQKIVLQIHDFPEEARYGNLKQIQKYVSLPLYPTTPNIRYVTINSRDREHLIDAGIPEEMVFLLNNPVEKPKNRSSGKDLKITGKRLNTIFSDSSPGYLTNAPFMVYPVRAIRRKNILEAGLIAKCSRVPVNLVVTLPGVSKSEAGYSCLVDECFREKLIQGISSAGIIADRNKISFPEIIEFSNLIISSSVQEGFGYLFINSLQWEKPLLARDLKILDDFRDIFKSGGQFFYRRVIVPMDGQKIQILRKKYTEKIGLLKNYLNNVITDKLSQNIEHMLKDQLVDFSFLSPEMQRDFLRELSDPGLLDTTQKLNAPVLTHMEQLLETDKVSFNSRSIKKFGLQAHARQIETIIQSFTVINRKGNLPPAGIEQKLLASYAGSTSVRLLNNLF